MADAILADTVKDNDRGVHREADDCQDGGHEEGVNLESDERPEDREDSNDHDDVMEQGGDGHRAHAEVREPERHPPEDSSRAENQQEHRLLSELSADDRTDVG